MMIIDEPFAAPELIEYLECTQEPVLLNSMAEKILERHSIKALGDEEFAACVNAGGVLFARLKMPSVGLLSILKTKP